jgi:hypothetical protein
MGTKSMTKWLILNSKNTMSVNVTFSDLASSWNPSFITANGGTPAASQVGMKKESQLLVQI